MTLVPSGLGPHLGEAPASEAGTSRPLPKAQPTTPRGVAAPLGVGIPGDRGASPHARARCTGFFAAGAVANVPEPPASRTAGLGHASRVTRGCAVCSAFSQAALGSETPGLVAAGTGAGTPGPGLTSAST